MQAFAERLDAAREEAENRLDAADLVASRVGHLEEAHENLGKALEETKEAQKLLDEEQSTQHEQLKSEMQDAAAEVIERFKEANEAREQGDAALEAKVAEVQEIVEKSAAELREQGSADLEAKVAEVQEQAGADLEAKVAELREIVDRTEQSVAELKEQGSADLEAKVAEVREIVDQNAQAVADLSSKAEAYDERFEETEKALGAVDEKVVSAVVSGCEEVLTRAEADRAVRVAQDRAADTKVNEFLAQLKHQIDDVAGMRQLLDETIDRVEKEEQDTKARMEGLEKEQKTIQQRSEEIERAQGLLDKTQGDLV
jgi:chromosome segregation ATPase